MLSSHPMNCAIPRPSEVLERQILVAFQRALREERRDVAEHLLRALDVLDPDFSRAPLQTAYRAVLELSERARRAH